MILEENLKIFFEKKEGLCKVMGIDKYENSSWIEGGYETEKEAKEIAEQKTDNHKHLASSKNIATIFYAYNSQGQYVGGDTWKRN